MGIDLLKQKFPLINEKHKSDKTIFFKEFDSLTLNKKNIFSIIKISHTFYIFDSSE